MTTHEAINILRNTAWLGTNEDREKTEQAVEVVAEALEQEHKWETCFDCPLSHGCPKIKGCTNEQAMEYASQIPNDCPLVQVENGE